MRKNAVFFRNTGKALFMGTFLVFACQTAIAGAAETDLPSYIVETVEAPQLADLVCEGEMELDFAQQFHVYFYQDGYELLDIAESGQYLMIPEDAEVPEGLDESITVLQKPLDHIYLQATSAMALFRALDSLDNIKMTGIRHRRQWTFLRNRKRFWTK